MKQPEKWASRVDALIQNHIENVQREILPENRQNIPLNRLSDYNQTVRFRRETYNKAREIIAQKTAAMGISYLAIIPVQIHDFHLGTVRLKLHHVDPDENGLMTINCSTDRLHEKFQEVQGAGQDPMLAETIIKEFVMRTGEYTTSSQPVALPDHPFSETIKICRGNGWDTFFYASAGNYHFKNFVSQEYWNVFEEYGEMLLATNFQMNHGQDRQLSFTVVLDQVPTIDKLQLLPTYQELCSSASLKRLHSPLGNYDFNVTW